MIGQGRKIILFLSLALLVCGCADGPTLYRGGTILTMDADDRVAEALLVDGDRIAAVGSEADLRVAAGSGLRIVDLGGRTLMPGFIDGHGHFPGPGIFAIHADLNSPPIGGVERIADIVSILASRAANARRGSWILGLGYDDSLLAEGRHPTRSDLDLASTEHPIAAIHISAHLVVVNSRALSLLGINRESRDPEGGVIRRDPSSGEPTGVLEETAAGAIIDRLQRPSFLDSIRVLRAAGKIYAQAGVTTAQNGLASERQVKALNLASRLGLVPLRLVLWPAEELADELLGGTVRLSSYDSAWVRIGAMKLVADGSIQGYTGYLGEPYFVVPGEDPGYRGYPRRSQETLDEAVSRYHAAGLQVAIHGNGDAAIDMVLDAVEAAQRRDPRKDARPVLVHAQMARDDQLERMKRLGVIPSFFVLHTYYWGDRHRDVFLGPRRAMRISPTRAAVDRGLRFTLHSDSPVVPMEPLRLVWSAVNRRSTSGAVIGAEQRISPLEALRAVTIDAAYQHFEEDIKGSLEPGKLADLVILSNSPLEDPENIDKIRVEETIVAGRTVYRRSP